MRRCVVLYINRLLLPLHIRKCTLQHLLKALLMLSQNYHLASPTLLSILVVARASLFSSSSSASTWMALLLSPRPAPPSSSSLETTASKRARSPGFIPGSVLLIPPPGPSFFPVPLFSAP